MCQQILDVASRVVKEVEVEGQEQIAKTLVNEFGMELKDVTDIAGQGEFAVFREAAGRGDLIKGINAGAVQFSRREVDELNKVVYPYGAKGLLSAKVTADGWQSSLAKHYTPEQIGAMNERLGAKEGDLLFLCAARKGVVNASLGRLRLHLGRRLDLIDDNLFAFTWITRFPLFEWSEEEGRFKSLHHPFTAPVDEELAKLETDPGDVQAKAYDMVLNGSEIGGGSIRIHHQDVQQKIFDLLGISREEAKHRFGFFLQALRYGTPPHGGIAFGFDRIVNILCKGKSIRDVVAFPKTQKAYCPLTDAPTTVADDQLEELGIRTGVTV